MKVIAGQSLLDIAIQESGSVLAAFDWALANNISLTAILSPGMELIAPQLPDDRDNDIANYFAGLNKKVATAASPEHISPIDEPGGIDFMAIEADFIIN